MVGATDTASYSLRERVRDVRGLNATEKATALALHQENAARPAIRRSRLPVPPTPLPRSSAAPHPLVPAFVVSVVPRAGLPLARLIHQI